MVGTWLKPQLRRPLLGQALGSVRTPGEGTNAVYTGPVVPFLPSLEQDPKASVYTHGQVHV